MAIGFHASHEQFPPSRLLKLVQMAEREGFAAAMTSDHISPWSERQGHSGNNWSWLGAALQATSLPFGSLAIPGGWRYHPVVLAQTIATLAEMFPNRLPWIAAGSGEALNELMVGQGWPEKGERHARLTEGVEIMRRLWSGETVTEQKRFIKAENARLWSLPKIPPKIYGAALSEETAYWMGSWADGLITVGKSASELEKILTAFWNGGGNNKPVALQMHVSWAENDDLARSQALDQWKCNIVGPYGCANYRTPEEFRHKAKTMPDNHIDDHVLISSDMGKYRDVLKAYLDLGITDIYIHNVGKNQEEFLSAFGADVIYRL